MTPIKIKVPITFAKAMNSEYWMDWLKAVELELESIRKNNKVAILTPVWNVESMNN